MSNIIINESIKINNSCGQNIYNKKHPGCLIKFTKSEKKMELLFTLEKKKSNKYNEN